MTTCDDAENFVDSAMMNVILSREPGDILFRARITMARYSKYPYDKSDIQADTLLRYLQQWADETRVLRG